MLAKKLAPYGYDPKQLTNTIWADTGAMVKNDGSRANEAAFWEVFTQVYGEKTQTDKPLFDAFYEKEFHEAKKFCGYNPAAAETVHQLQQMGYARIRTRSCFRLRMMFTFSMSFWRSLVRTFR